MLMKHLFSLTNLALILKFDQKNLLFVAYILITSNSFSSLLKTRLDEEELGCPYVLWIPSNVKVFYNDPRSLNNFFEVRKFIEKMFLVQSS